MSGAEDFERHCVIVLELLKLGASVEVPSWGLRLSKTTDGVFLVEQWPLEEEEEPSAQEAGSFHTERYDRAASSALAVLEGAGWGYDSDRGIWIRPDQPTTEGEDHGVPEAGAAFVVERP